MVFITKYKPFFEYGGWGFRKRLKALLLTLLRQDRVNDKIKKR